MAWDGAKLKNDVWWCGVYTRLSLKKWSAITLTDDGGCRTVRAAIEEREREREKKKKRERKGV